MIGITKTLTEDRSRPRAYEIAGLLTARKE